MSPEVKVQATALLQVRHNAAALQAKLTSPVELCQSRHGQS